MAVKFEFILSDVDAGNLLDILNGERTRAMSEARFYITRHDPASQSTADWYDRHADYIEELKQKILQGNTRVDSVV